MAVGAEPCYADVMPIRRITISVPEATARRIRRAARSRSVSAWVTEAIEARLDEGELERQFDAWYASVAPSRAAVARAEALLDQLTTPRRRKRAA